MSDGLSLDPGQEPYLRLNIRRDCDLPQYHDPVEFEPGAFLCPGEQARKIVLFDVQKERAATPGSGHHVSERWKSAEIAHAGLGSTRRDEDERPALRSESHFAHSATSNEYVAQPRPVLDFERTVWARRTRHRVYEQGARPVPSHHFSHLDGRRTSQTGAGRPAHEDDPPRRIGQPCRRPRG
jgi:hypothetical protein